METKNRIVTHVALFPDKSTVEEAYSAAIKYGYTQDEIHVIMTEDTRKKFFAGADTVSLELVVVGTLAPGLIGAGAETIEDGIISALIGAGVPEEQVKVYENGIKKGGIVISIKSHTTGSDKQLLDDWKRNKGTAVF